jgi:hypothetical protein
MSKLQACADWSRPNPSSPRLPVLGSVQSDLTVGPDRTEPYPRPGPSGLVESLIPILAAQNSILTKEPVIIYLTIRSNTTQFFIFWRFGCHGVLAWGKRETNTISELKRVSSCYVKPPFNTYLAYIASSPSDSDYISDLNWKLLLFTLHFPWFNELICTHLEY